MKLIRRALLLALCLMLGVLPAFAAEDLSQAFSSALAALKSPMEEALETGAYTLRVHQTAYVPSVAPALTPFDELESIVYPPVDGTFASSDEAVVSVDQNGLMTALSEGEATVSYEHGGESDSFVVTVSRGAIPEIAKNMIYVANREYYLNQRAKIAVRKNKYCKWYYGKYNDVGWCSVFAMYCANAAGSDLVKKTKIPEDLTDEDFLVLREGYPSKQYDGFLKVDRFTGIPRPGYLIIYGKLTNAYRTNHIAIVVDVVERGDGLYRITTVEGNMSNTVKKYCFLYDSKIDNSTVGIVKKQKLKANMSELPKDEQTDPIVQYELHASYFTVFGFCQTWK